jgi:hypothetical protein
LSVYNVLTKLKTKAAAGPDFLPTFLFKSIKCSIAYPLTLIFQSFLSVGTLPTIWRTALVRPIFKKGVASDPSNYRPIALTCVGCKIFESLVKDELVCYLSKNKLITEQQHGFLAKHSTCTNLLEALNEWTCCLNNAQSVSVAYIDFSRAFDSVSHPKLLSKLRSLGVCGLLLDIISSFLSCRIQSTIVGDSISDPAYMTSGVPQGSVLGPILFIIYINDIVNIFSNCTPSFFADDLKLYIKVSKLEDFQILQDNLFALHEWSNMWQLSIAFKKCSVLSIGKIVSDIDFIIDKEIIPLSNNVVDLGLTVDKDLNFSLHINSIVKSAHARANLILRCFISNDIDCLSRAFVTYVRPLLEYCSPLWSPSTVTAINQIEAVQRRFSKRLPGLYQSSYFTRLAVLGWTTLETRRIHTDLVLCFKIVHGLIATKANSIFNVSSSSIATRGHKFKLSVQHSNSNVRHNFFTVRIVPIWNDLPVHVVEASSVAVFKNFIISCDFSKYCTVELD